MSDPNPRSVVFVFGGATLGKPIFVARLSDPNWTPVRNKHYTHWSPVKLALRKNRCTAIDTPGFDLDSIYDDQNFQKVEDMVKAYVRRVRNKYQESATSIHFGAIYCYPVTSDQLSATARRDLRALVALCKCLQFNSFSIVPVWSLDAPEDQQKRTMQELLDHPQIGEIWDAGGQIFGPKCVPGSVLNHIITGSRPFDAPQDGVDWIARLAYAKAQLRTPPSKRDRGQELDVVQPNSRVDQVEDYTKSLPETLSLPSSSTGLQSLAKELEGLNRDISRIVKGIARHCKAERTIGVDKLIVEPIQLDAMHQLLSNGRGDRFSTSLYHSNTSRHMSVRLFLQSATALIICKTLHERVFQPFHPSLNPEINNTLSQICRSIQNNNNAAISGKWRCDAFTGLRQTAEQTQELQSDISLSMKEPIIQLFRILYGGPEAISAEKQAAFSTIDRPLAAFDALIRKAFDLNNRFKTDVRSFSTLYYPQNTAFDSHIMLVDEWCDEDQGDKHAILSTFGLGLVMECGSEADDGTEQCPELTIISRAIIVDESYCDVID